MKARSQHPDGFDVPEGTVDDFRRLIDVSHDAILTSRKDRIAFANPAAVRLWGARDAGDLIGRSTFDLFHADDHAAIGNPLRTMLATGQPTPLIEGRIVNLNGRVVEVEVAAAPVGIEKGVFQISVRDISNRRRGEIVSRQSAQARLLNVSEDARRELSATHERLKLVYERISDGVVALDREWRYTYVNQHATELLNLDSPEELIGKSIWTKYPKSFDRPSSRAYREAMETQKPIVVRDYYQSLNRWFENRIYPSPEGVTIYVHDVTEQAMAEQALRVSEERYRDLVENSRELISTHDLDGRLLSVNEALAKLIGYSRDQLAGMSLADLLAPEMAQAGADYLETMRSTGHVSGIMKLRTATGENRYWAYDSELRTEGLEAPVVRGIGIDVTDRVLAQKELKIKTEELDAYFTSALDLFCIANTNGVFKRLNNQWESTLGYALDELHGTCLLELVHHEDVPHTVKQLERLASQQGSTFVIRCRQADGAYRWLEWRSTPAGSLFYAAARDITERIEADQRIRANEVRLADSQSHAHLGSWELDLATRRFVWWSAELSRLHGQDPSLELPGFEEFLEMVHPEDRHLIKDPCASIPECTRPFSVEYRTNPSLRRQRQLSATLHIIRDESGSPIRIEGTTLDITERVRVEEALLATQSDYRALVESASDCIFVTDPHGRCNDVNAAGCAMLGYSREELLTKSISDIVAKDDARAGQEIGLLNAADSRDEWQFRRKDGSLFSGELSATLLPDGRLLGILRDISVRKQAQEKINKQLDELKQWYQATLGREDRVRQLKRDINTLLQRLGEPLRYPSQAPDPYAPRTGRRP